MSGTIKGGRAAAMTNKIKYGGDFYRQIGSIGGKRGHTGGFYANRELARKAGAKGGRISRRGIIMNPKQDTTAAPILFNARSKTVRAKFKKVPAKKYKGMVGSFYDWCERTGYEPSEHAHNTWLEELAP